MTQPRDDDRDQAVDTSRPSIARVYDYWLGGNNHSAADRQVAAAMLARDPDLAQRVRDNREFVTTVAGRAAQQGILQFLDLGAGLPTHPAVHEAARAINPLARVAYVDNDPLVVSQARALLATEEGTAALSGDLRDPRTVLLEPALVGVIDLSQPVCLILAAVAHFLPAAQAAELIAHYMARLAPGSWLAVSVAHFADEELLTRLYAMHTTAPFQNHGITEIASFLGGLELIAPGIAEVRRWLSGIPGTPAEASASMLCCVAVKG